MKNGKREEMITPYFVPGKERHAGDNKSLHQASLASGEVCLHRLLANVYPELARLQRQGA